MKFECGYCFVKLAFTFVVQHTKDQHNDKKIKIQTIKGRLMRKFKTLVCREDCRTISTNSMFETIQVSTQSFIPKESPLKKIIKL